MVAHCRTMNNENKKMTDTRQLLRFLLPSVLGVFFFLLPVRYEDGWTIPMGVLSALLTEQVGQYMPLVVMLIVIISAVLTCWYSLIKRPPPEGYTGLRRIFYVTRSWLFLRLLGMVFTVLIFFQLGPEWCPTAASRQLP